MGHNGAGKTTTIRILLGLLSPTSGPATIFDHDIIKDNLDVRRICDYLPDGYGLPKELTARQFLRYVGSMFGMTGENLERRINELLSIFHLTDLADRKLATYSSGMTQRVGLERRIQHGQKLPSNSCSEMVVGREFDTRVRRKRRKCPGYGNIFQRKED